MPGGLPPAKRAPLQPEKMAATIRLSPEQLHVLDRRSEEHTSELQSQSNLVCRLLLEKKKNISHQIFLFSLAQVNLYALHISLVMLLRVAHAMPARHLSSLIALSRMDRRPV